MARPSEYTPEIAAEICKRIGGGRTLTNVCRDDDMPCRDTVWVWRKQHKDFDEQYHAARLELYERWADEVIDIADDGTNDYVARENEQGRVTTYVDHDHINRSRLRVDQRKWMLAKTLPKIYGEKVEHSGPNGGPIRTVTRIELVDLDGRGASSTPEET